MNIVLQNVVSQIVNKNIGKNDSEILEDMHLKHLTHVYSCHLYLMFMQINCLQLSLWAKSRRESDLLGEVPWPRFNNLSICSSFF